MAIEVIGKDPSQYRKVTCRKCASELRYVLADVQERKVWDYTGGTDVVHFIICPCCGNEVFTKGY